MRRLSTTYKLTILLALLSLIPLTFLLDTYSSWETRQLQEHRLAACKQLAISASTFIRHQDHRASELLFQEFLQSNQEVMQLSLMREDGYTIYRMASERFQQASESGNLIRVPILRGDREWGSLNVEYIEAPITEYLSKMGQAIVLTIAVNLLTFGILLRKSLAVLNTNNTAPRRVRNALDTIAGGVVILDQQRRIVLANEAFQRSCHSSIESLTGKSLDSLGFRSSEDAFLPWDKSNDLAKPYTGITVFLPSGEEELCFLVNSTPISGQNESFAGTMVSFEDITLRERQRISLLQALAELETSKEQVHQQNLRLQELASKDNLTGLFNRRALFEYLDQFWSSYQESGQSLNCIMLDVDHFKKLNDNYGHAVGDDVLRNVAKTLQKTVGEMGIVGRYGGEEFCIALPGVDLSKGVEVAELVRRAIETDLAEPYAVTSSIGVSGVSLGASSCKEILEQADQALYAAKRGGRNAVCCWSPGGEEALLREVESIPRVGAKT